MFFFLIISNGYFTWSIFHKRLGLRLSSGWNHVRYLLNQRFFSIWKQLLRSKIFVTWSVACTWPSLPFPVPDWPPLVPLLQNPAVSSLHCPGKCTKLFYSDFFKEFACFLVWFDGNDWKIKFDEIQGIFLVFWKENPIFCFEKPQCLFSFYTQEK